jgi:glycosyltransferase involved in cell wall biosynthesis
MQPLVSIVICCHNRAHLLAQTIESVFAQQYQPVEIVVVDDGSTDHTPDLIANYGERVRYYRHENKGTPFTRTRGCQLAKGEFIAFQDDDDLMAPDRISVLYEALMKYPSARLAVGDWAVIDQKSKLTGERSRHNIGVNSGEIILIKDGYKAVLWPEISPIPHNTLFRKSDGERIGWFDTRFYDSIEDADFFARLGQLGAVVYVPKVVSYYRIGHSQKMSRGFINAYNRLMLFEKHLRNLGTGQNELQNRLRIRLYNNFRLMAIYEARGAQAPETVSADLLKSGFSLLQLKHKMSYWFLTRLKLPLRKVLAKNPWLSSLFLNEAKE